MKFAITLEPDEDGFIVVSCPALPGCRSQGRNREEAIAKAKEKAKQIAKQSGLRLGRVINYYEYEDGGYYYPEYSMAADSYTATVQENMVTPLITPGEKEVNLRVTLTYRVY